MGYSNNKWRKILIILTIINLFFAIFCKFNKVFATTNVDINDFPPIPNEYINQNFIIIRYPNNNTYYFLFLLNDLVNDNTHVLMTQNGTSLSFPTGSGKWYRTPLIGGTSWEYRGDIATSTGTDRWASAFSEILLSSVDIYDVYGDIVFEKNYNKFIPPNFDNITEIENGYPDGVFVSRGSYSENDYLYFHLLKITDTVPDGNQTTYYYDSKIFKLKIGTKYYRTYPSDTEHTHSYYYIKRSDLTLDTDSSYLYVLSNSNEKIDSSYGILQPDIPGGIYDVIDSDTAGVITEQEALNDKISNLNDTQQEIANSQEEVANNSNNINNFLTENTVSNDTNTNIDTNLNFNNQNTILTNLNNGFFTRLSNILTDISTYDLSEDTSVTIPLPHSESPLILHSIYFYNYIVSPLREIINGFWLFIFTYYLWRLINKLYIAVSSGTILDNFSSNGEAITSNML